MAELARFFGIAIYMNWRDHNPLHVHAMYGDHEALVSLDGAALLGSCPAMPCPWSTNGWRSTATSWSRIGSGRENANPCNPSIRWSDPMILHTTEVTPAPGYRLALRFNNGESGTVDLSDELDGQVFEPLKDPTLFATAYQHPVMTYGRLGQWRRPRPRIPARLASPPTDAGCITDPGALGP